MQAAGGTSIARATYVPVRKLYVFVFLRLSLVSYIWYLVYDRHAPTSRHTGLLKCVPGIMCTVPTGGEKVRRIDYKILNFCLRTWSNGGIPPPFSATRGRAGKTRPQETPPSAPACLKFNSDGLARCPQPMASTHTFFLIVFRARYGELRAP